MVDSRICHSGGSNTWRATLSFSQNLYSGGRNGAQMALAASGHESAQLGLTTTRAQLLFEVTEAYYDAVLSEQLVNIAAATLEQAGATLRQVEAGFNAGTQPEFEVLRARVNRDTQQPVLIRQRVNRALAYLRLKRLLDLPADADLQLADALADDALPPPADVRRAGQCHRADVGLERNAVVDGRRAVAARARRRRAGQRDGTDSRGVAAADRSAADADSYALNSSYGRIAYPDNFLPSFDRANWTVGVSVSVPILTGGRQRGDELVARAELEQSRLQQKQIEELAALDTRSAWAELLAARAAWESTRRHGPAGGARLPDRRCPLRRGCLDAARTVRRAGAAPAGRSEPCRGGA